MKKLLLSLGTVATVALPVAAVISCGNKAAPAAPPKTDPGNGGPGNGKPVPTKKVKIVKADEEALFNKLKKGNYITDSDANTFVSTFARAIPADIPGILEALSKNTDNKVFTTKEETTIFALIINSSLVQGILPAKMNGSDILDVLKGALPIIDKLNVFPTLLKPLADKNGKFDNIVATITSALVSPAAKDKLLAKLKTGAIKLFANISDKDFYDEFDKLVKVIDTDSFRTLLKAFTGGSSMLSDILTLVSDKNIKNVLNAVKDALKWYLTTNNEDVKTLIGGLLNPKPATTPPTTPPANAPTGIGDLIQGKGPADQQKAFYQVLNEVMVAVSTLGDDAKNIITPLIDSLIMPRRIKTVWAKRDTTKPVEEMSYDEYPKITEHGKELEGVKEFGDYARLGDPSIDDYNNIIGRLKTAHTKVDKTWTLADSATKLPGIGEMKDFDFAKAGVENYGTYNKKLATISIVAKMPLGIGNFVDPFSYYDVYFDKKFGLAGTNAWVSYAIDSFATGKFDYINKIAKFDSDIDSSAFAAELAYVKSKDANKAYSLDTFKALLADPSDTKVSNIRKLLDDMQSGALTLLKTMFSSHSAGRDNFDDYITTHIGMQNAILPRVAKLNLSDVDKAKVKANILKGISYDAMLSYGKQKWSTLTDAQKNKLICDLFGAGTKYAEVKDAKAFLDNHNPKVTYAGKSDDEILALKAKTAFEDFAPTLKPFKTKFDAALDVATKTSPTDSFSLVSEKTKLLLKFIDDNFKTVTGEDLLNNDQILKLFGANNWFPGFAGAFKYVHVDSKATDLIKNIPGPTAQDFVTALKSKIGTVFTQDMYDKLATNIFTPLGLTV